MAILIDVGTRIAVQTAFEGYESRSILKMPVYASNTVAHVTSRGTGYAGADHWFLNSLPIFASMGEAVARAKANAALIYAAPALAVGAVLAAIDAGVPLVVLIAEDVPAEGRALIRAALADTDTVLVGPGAPELVTPDGCQIGATPSYIFARGRIGILSESGALAREAALQTSALGLGQSSVISLNRTPLSEGAFIHCLKQFLDDGETDSIVLLTDGNGQIETAVAALLVAEGHSKPIVAHIGAPPAATEASAVAALRDAGVTIVESPARIGVAVKTALDGRDSERRVRLAASDFVTVMRQVEQEIYGAPQEPVRQSA
jgi:succinyl-CoA synthetase alpha subunit